MDKTTVKGKKLGNKAKFLISSIICAVLLAQCEFVRVMSSQIIIPIKEVDFPLGENRKMSYHFSSFLEKTYIINLLFEIEVPRNPETIEPSFSMKDIPLDLFIQCFKLNGKEEKLMFEKHYLSTQDRYGGNGWTPKNPKVNNGFGYAFALGGFDAATGQYRCDFSDKSSPNIKQEFINSSVSITPHISFK
ncbi:hypothetical protein [Conchiformibius kuhniae]|uniref:Lipoprotein n=1 Tax=Conchiformibius kuhniae TaxID=211502 RepID=A0A8T9MSH5_9NEIS|nr:hypothetical protein [Conchiformibius kuhniae]UOP04557.1 hypothetical protein LVJ77_09875 [Conchiformibius kuhniae]